MQKSKSNGRYILLFVILISALLALMLWSISTGSVSIPFREAWNILFHRSGQTGETYYTVIHEIRIPRVIAASLLGGALSVSGFLLQTFFGNPIAGPYILGISSGARLVVALTMVFLLSRGIMTTPAVMILAAFIGSMLAMGFVLAVSFRIKNMSLLVVCGIMIGYICTAVTDLVVTFADDSNIVNLHNWSLGSFSGISWSNVRLMAVLTGIVLVFTFLLSKPIGACQMGENYARNMGVNVKRLRIILILLSSFLSAIVTAFAGPISFVGVAVPHLMKMLMKTARPLVLIPGCFLGGAIITLFCDDMSRLLFAPTELAVSSVTAILLAPVVIIMMVRRKGGRDD